MVNTHWNDDYYIVKAPKFWTSLSTTGSNFILTRVGVERDIQMYVLN